MRIRKEISAFNYRMMIKVILIFLLVFNAFYFATVYLDQGFDQMNIASWITFSVFYPAMLASILSQHFRTATLYINDYQSLPSFHDKLNARILKEKFELESETSEALYYRPTSWVNKLFNYWAGVEKLTVHLGDEIRIHGSLKKVSDIEDILTWNKDFRGYGASLNPQHT